MDNDNKELLLRNLNSIVTELICNYGVTHDSIKEEIYKTVKEQSDKLPRLNVLYNKTYGGFGHSQDFMDYKADKLDDLEKIHKYEHVYKYRVYVVNEVKKYGAYCKDRFR